MARTVWSTCLACVCSGLLAPSSVTAEHGGAGAHVVILCSPHSSYRLAANSLKTSLDELGYDVLLIELPAQSDPSATNDTVARVKNAQPGVVATVGPATTSLALAEIPDIPIVFLVVPNVLDREFAHEFGNEASRLAGVTSDVAPAEQADWVRRLDPNVRRLAILHTDRTKQTALAIMDAGRAANITVLAIEADKEAFPKAIDDLNNSGCDGVLMIPDAKLYNSATVQRLLLWGIRNKTPVWSFSANIVKAGALAAQYPSYEAIGSQASDVVHRCVTGEAPATIGLQYPEHITKAINKRTADMIGLKLREDLFDANTVRFGTEP